MSAMVSRSASESSFIFVDDPSIEDQTDNEMNADDLSSLDSLSAFLPTLHAPHAFQWDDTHLRQVDQARHQRQHGRLCIDELLLDLELDGKSISSCSLASGTDLYPPTSISELHSLLCAVLDAPDGDLIRTHSVIYYILLAVCDGTESTVPHQFAYASEFLLPSGTIKTVQGVFALDTGSWQRAIAALSDPHVVPDWISETLAVLSTCPPIEQRASYVLSFWRLKGITLSDPNDLALILDALCDATRKRGVVEAWALQRQWIDETHRDELANRVLSQCFGDNSLGKPVAHHVRALLAQPFTSHEDALVDAFCRSPPSDNIAKTLAVDWRLSKLIAESRPLDALRFWSTVKATVPASEDRLRLLKAAQATLTEVQQNTLALEEDVDIIPASNSISTSKSALEATSKTTSNLTQPAWQPVPAPTSAPLPRSLLSIPSKVASSSRPTNAKAPSASDLPLSASPFLRREKPLVSSVDASSLGGVQKSMLLALREGESSGHFPAPDSPGPTADLIRRASGPLPSTANLFGMSPMRESSVATTSLFGGSPARKPTLGGFGSVRQPGASSHYGKAREASPSLFGGPRAEITRMSDAGDDDLTMLSPPQAEASEADEEEEAAGSSRAGRSKSASTSKSAPTFTAKRRNVSNGTAAGAGEKRRAVSTEAEDRPSSSIKVSSNKPPAAPSSSTRQKPPGAFPSGFESESHDEDDDVDDAPQQGATKTRRSAASTTTTTTTTTKKSVAKRSSARASSAAAPGSPSTPKAKKGSSFKVETPSVAAQETPRVTTVRRSTRLQTPARDEASTSVPTSAPRSTRKGGAGGATKRLATHDLTKSNNDDGDGDDDDIDDDDHENDVDDVDDDNDKDVVLSKKDQGSSCC
ncbi:BZ3500_MvSof-1268-A1-R1_Chr3-1g05875 [Microbotryum saponariae]|uniref:BZ3500_MvSof-1268-A1-R1_Chr3-1g05875 protein n=1 Tax=Microbotryum saponariae TaxID=289078 RepID=A0A2X0KYF4_9BASI|nr:BZ3500_MvSof-1268-A1-R1_Chr3-1g05875 [Microbotryum saponariae]SDA05065.1 BZ3501_MvSof-1269-A2-R1_Chr3-1g05545 [Microbotryum saponariae]